MKFIELHNKIIATGMEFTGKLSDPHQDIMLICESPIYHAGVILRLRLFVDHGQIVAATSGIYANYRAKDMATEEEHERDWDVNCIAHIPHKMATEQAAYCLVHMAEQYVPEYQLEEVKELFILLGLLKTADADAAQAKFQSFMTAALAPVPGL